VPLPHERTPHRIDLIFPRRDETTRRLIARLSDPETGPHADNLVSNEDSYPRVAGELARRVEPGGVYLGVGPDQNLTLLAAASPSLAFVIDYRRRNLLLHLLHKALFALSTERVSYLERLTGRSAPPVAADASAEQLVATFFRSRFEPDGVRRAIEEVDRFLRPFDFIRDPEWAELATMHSRLAGPGMNARFLALPMYPTLGRLVATTDREGRPAHFLASERLYSVVRSLQFSDRVIPLVGDLAAPGSLTRLGDWLRARCQRVSVFYVSDVEFFLLRTGRFGAYLANLDRLPWAEGAVIVRTSTREIAHPERVAGDSSTTIVRPVSRFLASCHSGRITSPDDLFRQHSD
jgi:hypothetical protein